MLITERIKLEDFENLKDLGNLEDFIKSFIGNEDNIKIYCLVKEDTEKEENEDTEKEENKELEDKRVKELSELKIYLDKLKTQKNQIEKEIKKVYEDIISFDFYLKPHETRTVISDYYLLLCKHLKLIEERLNFTEKNYKQIVKYF